MVEAVGGAERAQRERRMRRMRRVRCAALTVFMVALVCIPMAVGSGIATAVPSVQPPCFMVVWAWGPPREVLVGELVTGSVSLIALCSAVPAPLNAVVVWEPPLAGASDADARWRARVRDYVAESLTDRSLGMPRVSVVAAARGAAPACGPTASRDELHACLMRLDGEGEPHLPSGLARLGPERLAMRQALTRTLGLREWVVAFSDAAGADDCDALAAQGDVLDADERIYHIAGICATPGCRRSCLEGFTGRASAVREAGADLVGLLWPVRNPANYVTVRIVAAEVHLAMSDGGKIETPGPSADVERPSARSVVWRLGALPKEGITVTWTARAQRPGLIDWAQAVDLVLTDTLGVRHEQTYRPLPGPGLALAPVLWPDQGGRIWLPVAER